MSHRYYSDDFEDGSTDRLSYFDNWFKVLANEVAKAKGITLSSYLSQIQNFESFVAVLEESFNQDASLGQYVGGMSNKDLRNFFNRTLIQDIVQKNKRDDEIVITRIPAEVVQEDKKTILFFPATIKGKKVVARKVFITVRGKRRARYIDSRGRFAKIS